MTLLIQTNTASALSRRMMKYKREVHPTGDFNLADKIEVHRYSTGDYSVVLRWENSDEIRYIHNFPTPIQNYFDKKFPDMNVKVIYRGLSILGGIVELSLQVQINEW